MRIKLNKASLIICIIFVLHIFSYSTIAADTNRIEIIPESPEPESEIELIAYIYINNVEQVNLKIQECNIKTGLCYPDTRVNISMNKVDDNTYITSHKLLDSRSTYFEIDLLVKTDSGWKTLIDKEKTNLSIIQNNGNGNQNTPGFEIIGIFLGILSIMLILRKRKR